MAVTEPGFGVRLVDISEKDNPREARTILSSNVTDSSIKDNYLFLHPVPTACLYTRYPIPDVPFSLIL